MIEFSDAPYQFFSAKPSPLLIKIARFANRFIVLPGKNHRISKIEISGKTEAVPKSGHVMFVINHPSHSDAQIVTELHRQLGVNSCYMAAYDVFLRGKLQAAIMQRLGNFSIDRDGSDRKAMATAMDVIKKGEMALNVFPEGNVYLTNDRVTSFMDGAAFIALKAQQALGEIPVTIIPISLKITHLTRPREQLIARMVQLAKDSGYTFPENAEAKPVAAVIGLGRHVAQIKLGRCEVAKNSDCIHNELLDQAERIIASLEVDLELQSKTNEALSTRIAKVRSKIHQQRSDPNSEPTEVLKTQADRAILALRFVGYGAPYLSEKPTLDRFDETVERIAEDFYSKAMPRIGSRKAMIEVGQAIDVSTELSAAGGKLRPAVTVITRKIEAAVQAGVDRLNEKNREAGSKYL